MASAERLVLGGGINRNWPLCDGWGDTRESRPLYALDATDPAAAPEPLHTEAFASDAAGRVAVALLQERGLSERPDRLAVWDLDRPGPAVELPLPDRAFGGEATSLATDGRRAVVATADFVGQQTGPALHLVDLRDPAAPRLEATIPVSEVVQTLVLEEDRVLAAQPGHGLLLVTLGAAGEPPRLGRLELPTSSGQLTRGPGWLLATDRCNADVLVDEEGARLRHVATVRHERPAVGGRLDLQALYRSGASVYLAATGNNDWVIDQLDLGEPAAPRSRQILAGAGHLSTATAAGGYVYLGRVDDSEFTPGDQRFPSLAVDLREPDRPRLGPERFQSDLFAKIYTSEAGTFAQGYLRDLYRVDLTDPLAPGTRPLNVCGAPWMPWGWGSMIIQGRYGYLLPDGVEGPLYIMDLAARPQPRRVGTLALKGRPAFLVDAGDSRLWMVVPDRSVLAYDLRDPAAPTLAYSLSLPDRVTDLSARGDLLDVTTDMAGLWRYRLPAAAPMAAGARPALSPAQAEQSTCATAWLPALARP